MISIQQADVNDLQLYKNLRPVNIKLFSDLKLYMNECLLVLAARPGMGKSSTACKIAADYLSDNHKVLYYSGEMPKPFIVKRVCDSLINNKYLNNLYIIDKSLCDESVHITAINDIAIEYKVDLIIIDQLSLLDKPLNFNDNDKHNIISENIKQLALLQRRLQIPIVVLSQLNRSSKSDNELDLCNIAESDMIGQYATAVIAISLSKDDQGFILKDHFNYQVLKARYGVDNFKGEYIINNNDRSSESWIF